MQLFPHFGLIQDFVPDYMHCALLGVTWQVLHLWLNSTNALYSLKYRLLSLINVYHASESHMKLQENFVLIRSLALERIWIEYFLAYFTCPLIKYSWWKSVQALVFVCSCYLSSFKLKYKFPKYKRCRDSDRKIYFCCGWYLWRGRVNIQCSHTFASSRVSSFLGPFMGNFMFFFRRCSWKIKMLP